MGPAHGGNRWILIAHRPCQSAFGATTYADGAFNIAPPLPVETERCCSLRPSSARKEGASFGSTPWVRVQTVRDKAATNDPRIPGAAKGEIFTTSRQGERLQLASEHSCPPGGTVAKRTRSIALAKESAYLPGRPAETDKCEHVRLVSSLLHPRRRKHEEADDRANHARVRSIGTPGVARRTSAANIRAADLREAPPWGARYGVAHGELAKGFSASNRRAPPLSRSRTSTEKANWPLPGPAGDKTSLHYHGYGRLLNRPNNPSQNFKGITSEAKKPSGADESIHRSRLAPPRRIWTITKVPLNGRCFIVIDNDPRETRDREGEARDRESVCGGDRRISELTTGKQNEETALIL
uniref:Uncharacterized protein n=1 Tax=Trichuris muris TaxID=70415 RepID=A0A5S6QXG8_TRIMR